MFISRNCSKLCRLVLSTNTRDQAVLPPPLRPSFSSLSSGSFLRSQTPSTSSVCTCTMVTRKCALSSNAAWRRVAPKRLRSRSEAANVTTTAGETGSLHLGLSLSLGPGYFARSLPSSFSTATAVFLLTSLLYPPLADSFRTIVERAEGNRFALYHCSLLQAETTKA